MSTLHSLTLPVIALLISVSAAPRTVLAQAASNPEAREAFDAPRRLSYEERITRTRLNGHYIPYDINDAMRELEEITSTASQSAYAERDEDFVVERLYFSLGRWLGVNWGLYDGSRMSAYFRELGVDAADGQIEMLMRLYHRHLNGEPLGVKGLAEAYKAEKAAEQEARRARGEVIESYVIPADSVENGNLGGG